MFGLSLCLCLMSISHVAAQGFFPQMAGGLEGMDPYAQHRQMNIELIDARIEAAEGLPPMQQKQIMQHLNQQKMALKQNNGYQQQYGRMPYQMQLKPNTAVIQTPFRVQNTGYQAPYYMQQYPPTYNGLPQSHIYVYGTQNQQQSAKIPMQPRQYNIISAVPQTGRVQVVMPQAARPMPHLRQIGSQIPQIIIVAQNKPDTANSVTSPPTLASPTPKPIQSLKTFANGQTETSLKMSGIVINDKKTGTEKYPETIARPQLTTPSSVVSNASVILNSQITPDAARKTLKTQDANRKNVYIQQVIDDALKEHIKKKQQALEVSLKAQLLAKQKALEAALQTQILNKHKTLEAALNAEISNKHQSSEAALKNQILSKQKTLEALLKAQMLAKHKALEAAMEAMASKNLNATKTADTINRIAITQRPVITQNKQPIPADTRNSQLIKGASKAQEIKQINLGTQDARDQGQKLSIRNIKLPSTTHHQNKTLTTFQVQQPNIDQNQFRRTIVLGKQTRNNNQAYINGINILGTVKHYPRGQIQLQSQNTRPETRQIINPMPVGYDQQLTTDSVVESVTVAPTTVQILTSTAKPSVIQAAKVPEKRTEIVREPQSQQMIVPVRNGDSSRRIPKLMIKLSPNEASQRNIFKNMKSADRKRLVNYFLRRIVRQPSRDTGKTMTRTVKV